MAEKNNRSEQSRTAANHQRLQAENEGLLRRLINAIRRLFGGGQASPETNHVNEQPSSDPKASLLSRWDALSDKTDELQQGLKKELQDLYDGKPSPTEGSHPVDVDTHVSELKKHDTRIAQAMSRYSMAITVLQKERDGLLAQAAENGEELPGIDALDAKLGADGEGPGYASLKALRMENSDALSSCLQHDSLSTPNSDIDFKSGIVTGAGSRLAIGARLLEITQQGLNGGDGIDQTALNREFAKLMPVSDEGILNRQAQMEQKANLAFASTMTGVLQEYHANFNRNHQPMGLEQLQESRAQALQSPELLALSDIRTQDVPFTKGVELRVDSFRIEREKEMANFEKGYASMADQAALDSTEMAAPTIQYLEPTEGVDLIRTQEERRSIARQISQMVSEVINNRNTGLGDEQMDYDAVDALLAPLAASPVQTDLNDGDTLNQLRNVELAERLLSSVKAVDHTSDMQRWPNAITMAVATSNPSDEELKARYQDEHGKIEKDMIREHVQATLAVYRRDIDAERREQKLETPSMAM